MATELGDSTAPDEFVATVLPVQALDYDLKSGLDNPDTCQICGHIEVDIDGGKRVFLSVQGTLGVEWVEEDTFVSNHEGRLFNTIFVEAEQTDTGWNRKGDGECLFVPTAEWNYQHNKLPVMSVYNVQSGEVPVDRSVTLANVTVTAKNYNGIWVQSGTGPRSGIRVDAGTVQEKIVAVGVGDVATIVGRYREVGYKNQSVIDVHEGSIEITDPGAGTPEATVISGSFGDEQWEGVLVRVEGPFVLETVVDEDATLLPHFTASGPNGVVVAQPWLYEPWFDPASLPRFSPGAEMDSLTGILDSYFDSRQDLMPRSASDFEGYTPAP